METTTEKKILALNDFKRVEIKDYIYYLKADLGEYEITLEPHLQAGFTVGIYHTDDPFLAIQKRSVWRLNHPKGYTPEKVAEQIIGQVLDIAQDFYETYVLKIKQPVNKRVYATR